MKKKKSSEGIDARHSVQQWQIAYIKEGLRQADAGEFATDNEVADAFARLRNVNSRQRE